MRLEPFVRALVVVGSHQPRITRDVGRQDRCKTASSGHGTVTHAPGYLLRGIAPLYRQPACSNILPSRPGGAHSSTGSHQSGTTIPTQPGRLRATPLMTA